MNVVCYFVYFFAYFSVLKISLDSHNTSGLAEADTDRRVQNQKQHINKLIMLRRFAEAWLFCDAIDEIEQWKKLGEAAIADLNVEFGKFKIVLSVCILFFKLEILAVSRVS